MKASEENARSPYQIRRLGQHPRILPDSPHHYMHRGDHLIELFERERHRPQYLDAVGRLRDRCGISIHAFCLMPNHVHFILGATKAGPLDEFMKGLAELHGSPDERSSTSILCKRAAATRLVSINTMRQGLTCSRYIELNPVTAGIAERPEDGCSSYRSHVGLEQCRWLGEAPWFRALARSATERRALYRDFVDERQQLLHHTLAALDARVPKVDE